VVAVIDIGMTNKKVAVYDESLRQLDAQYRNFAPKIVNGLQCHDLEEMEAWFLDELAAAAKRFPIKAIAISTHGATFVCVGKDGRPALPCVYYTHEPGENFHKKFYEQFGEAQELQARTGTPAFKALINPAKGIFFAQQQFTEGFKNTSVVLPYPQYWGFRLTGKAGAEGTYMGNHTYLWDYLEGGFSTVAHKLGIASLIPGKLCKPWDILGTINEETSAKTGLPKDTIVTMGIHDSNSALLPHFAKKGEGGFILNSTGTWCVIMNPVDKYGFSPDELGKVVFFNISAFGTLIKTAIFLGGLEFETWSSLILKKHGRNDTPAWNEGIYRSILGEKRIFLLPELTPSTGQFPNSRARIKEDKKTYFFNDNENSGPPCFADYEKSFAVLRISLVMQTMTAIERSGIKDGFDIFTEGGFRKDESYSILLSSAFPNNKVYLTDINEATALGAAMTAKMALKNISLRGLVNDFEIGYFEKEKKSFVELEPYRKAWLAEVNY
jgi:sugar (pentulose or hexulose) kinase